MKKLTGFLLFVLALILFLNSCQQTVVNDFSQKENEPIVLDGDQITLGEPIDNPYALTENSRGISPNFYYVKVRSDDPEMVLEFVEKYPSAQRFTM